MLVIHEYRAKTKTWAAWLSKGQTSTSTLLSTVERPRPAANETHIIGCAKIDQAHDRMTVNGIQTHIQESLRLQNGAVFEIVVWFVVLLISGWCNLLHQVASLQWNVIVSITTDLSASSG